MKIINRIDYGQRSGYAIGLKVHQDGLYEKAAREDAYLMNLLRQLNV